MKLIIEQNEFVRILEMHKQFIFEEEDVFACINNYNTNYEYDLLTNTDDPNIKKEFNQNGKFTYYYSNKRIIHFNEKKEILKKGTFECLPNGYIVRWDDGSFKEYIIEPQEQGQQTQTQQPAQPQFQSITFTEDDVKCNGKLVKKGMKGDIVRKIQEKLIEKGFKNVSKSGNPDGFFGGRTKQMVKNFQTANGLEDDGIVGPKTWEKLFGEKCGSGSSAGGQTTGAAITLPRTISGSFSTTDADAAHNFKEMEDKLGPLLKEIYNQGINPKITSVTAAIKKSGNNYNTTYSATIDKSDDGKAWVGFTSRGSIGEGYVERADGQISGKSNADNKSLNEKLATIGAGEVINIAGTPIEDASVPFKQYFVQFTKPKDFPPKTSQATRSQNVEPNKPTQSGQEPTTPTNREQPQVKPLPTKPRVYKPRVDMG